MLGPIREAKASLGREIHAAQEGLEARVGAEGIEIRAGFEPDHALRTVLISLFQRIDPFRGEGMFHPGTDIYAPYRSVVMSPADGLVIFIGPRHGYGNLVIVSHGYGISTKMAHPSKIAATIGQEVRRGPTVGYVGSSGRATDPHLHYEVLVNEISVNPAKYLKRQAPQQIVQLLVSSPS